MTKRALANQQRAVQAERLQRLLRSSLLLAATVLSLGTVGLLAADQLYRPDAFVIEQLKIKGRFKHLEPAAVEAVVVQHQLGNFFSIDLAEIERQIEKLAWVQSAKVRREWPNTLIVDVQEQRPVMRWNSHAWVNSLGEVVELPGTDFVESPISLQGHRRDARKMLIQSLQWQSMLASSGLTLNGLQLSESHAYRLELSEVGANHAFELQLGRREVQARLDRFLKLFNTRLKSANQRLVRVDARYPDGLAISAQQLVEKAEELPAEQRKPK